MNDTVQLVDSSSKIYILLIGRFNIKQSIKQNSENSEEKRNINVDIM